MGASGARNLGRVAVVWAIGWLSVSATAEPITRQQLLRLVTEGVDSKVIVALVKKDCVGFTLDATAVLELSKQVPAEVLAAAIDCQRTGPANPVPAVPAGPAAAAVPAPASAKPAAGTLAAPQAQTAPAVLPAATPAAAPAVPSPVPAAVRSGPAPAPAPASSGKETSRIRLSASQDASDESGYSSGAPERCVAVIDYAGPIKVLKGGEGYRPHPSFRDDFPGVKVFDLDVPRFWEKGPREWVEVSPGAHTLSLFCRTAWTRTDVDVDLESAVDYRVLLRFGWSGRLQVAGVEPDR
ncbi:MAG: hypothetical protein IT186_10565 [Acidobacteria bacterium]|nr:hypothetical protein [Acidobacteriota bacterium]